MNIISYLVDILHILFIFTPIIIFFIPKKYFYITKIIILLLFLTPIHWTICDNKCVLTILSQKLGGLIKVHTNSPFTERYLKPVYGYIFKLLNVKNTEKNINKFVSIQWIIMYIIIFYYIFYHLKCRII